MKMSIIYDRQTPVEWHQSKCNMSWMPTQGVCYFIGFAILLICTAAGFSLNMSKFHHLSASEENIRLHTSMLLNKFTSTNMGSIQLQFHSLQLKHQRLDLEQKQLLRNAKCFEVTTIISMQINLLELKYLEIYETMSTLISEHQRLILSLNASLQKFQEEQEQQQDLLYKQVCDTKKENPINCCRHGWFRHASNCYLPYREKRKNWKDAQNHCESMNSLLVKIETDDEQAFLTDLVDDHDLQPSAWIGLNDIEVEGQFKWVDGTDLSDLTFWEPKEPNNNHEVHGQDCVTIKARKKAKKSNKRNKKDVKWYHSWDDVICNARRYFMCKACILCDYLD
ncbi:C-type lectin domain family 4 member E-like isoform X2 [Phyllopteryx taeniolatus]|nr:C-type lectin domain family 4 member E-like isoform X2 [Phyllopteryx taeniolatus]XP_061609690.1 C-type lectin domain family 4 member E-like isoform X2 [Phyllopteryx taeniolatus]